ncbi:DUF502 domain-containing protein [Haloarcula litorea]|uniref:DUF502 domain-containing protein n=1 Tax=Haloarcula litorea TaxID=3032579 RepID=UPI0023E87427|nr:DUF502 domain-containing protein [Halomicroarcula sp. GDY20]
MSDSRGPSVSSVGVRTTARQAMLTGFALTVPLLVTVLIIAFVVNSLSNVLDPVVLFLYRATGSELQPSETPEALVKVLAVLVFVVSIFAIGLVAERREGEGRIENVFDAMMERIPGVGSLYTSFDEMSEMLLDSDTQSFKEVVLVEYPTEGSYAVAFVTANTPESIEAATANDDMVTLFMPMAPNPVMGGYVIHVDSDRVFDVDMTVEEGVRSIVTSGVAIGEGSVSLPIGQQPSSAGAGHPIQAQYGHEGAMREPTPRTMERERDREEAYSDDVAPEHAETPDAVARRQRRGRDEPRDDSQPDDVESGEGTIGRDERHPADVEKGDGTIGREETRPSDLRTDEDEGN